MIDGESLLESGWKQGAYRVLVIRTIEQTNVFNEVRDVLYACLRPGDTMRWNGYSLYVKFYDGVGSFEFDNWLGQLRYEGTVVRDGFEWWDAFTNGSPVRLVKKE